MKRISFFILLILFSIGSFAQLNDQKVSYQLKIDKYKRMKSTGIVMVVAGSIATVVGISNISNAEYTTSTNPYTGATQRTTNDPAAVTGALLVLGGAGLLGGGIPLTIIGSKKSQQYQRRLDALSIHLNLNLQQQGLALSYKF
jgi:lysylphosphatidylglycerol synthetase-like protein (DUF2156 family)